MPLKFGESSTPLPKRVTNIAIALTVCLVSASVQSRRTGIVVTPCPKPRSLFVVSETEIDSGSICRRQGCFQGNRFTSVSLCVCIYVYYLLLRGQKHYLYVYLSLCIRYIYEKKKKCVFGIVMYWFTSSKVK